MSTIAISKPQHRFDNATKPLLTIGGAGSYPKLYIPGYEYRNFPVTNQFLWSPPNRTDLALPIYIRDAYLSTWTLSAGVNNSSNNFLKTANEGFSGAYATNVAAGNCSIEGKPTTIYGNTVFALQSGVFSFDYYSANNIEHALVFNATQDNIVGFGRIIERGVQKQYFTWEVGDTGLLEHFNGVVYYWQIKSDGTPILLRAKRSLLSYPITPTLVLYHVNAGANDVRIWEGSGDSAQIDLFGVLEDFQDWENAAQFESLADKTMTKDKIEDFTYFSSLKNLQTLSINIRWDEEEKYKNALEFFKWHDLNRPFIYKDAARKNEFFAQFVSAFKDNPLGADIFGMSADIRQVIEPPLIMI